MKTEQIIKTLQDHNDWRRGIGKWDNGEKANYFDTISAYQLGQTIDAAIEQLQELLGKRWLIKHYERIYDESDKGTVTEGIGNCVKQLKKERDEARHIASYWRNIPLEDLKWKHKFPWEKGNE